MDASIAGELVSVERLMSFFTPYGFDVRLPDAVAFARRSNVLLLRHTPSGVPIDITLAWLPFETEMLEATERRDFAGVPIPVPTVTESS